MPAPTLTGAFPATAAQRAWQEYLDGLEIQLLPMAQEAAKQWTAALGAVTGGLGIVTLVQGRNSVSDLATPVRATVGALVALAVLLAATAVYLGTGAARGVPALDPTQFAGLEQGRSRVLEEKDRALRLLGLSRRAAGLALIAIVVAVGLTWFGPH